MHLVIKKGINKAKTRKAYAKKNGSAVMRDDEPHRSAPLTEEPGYIGR